MLRPQEALATRMPRVYEGTTVVQMNNKESVICEFEIDFKKSFCCGFNLGNSKSEEKERLLAVYSSDDVISLLCKHVILCFVAAFRAENEYGF